jgi:hypothetical protein
MDTLRTLATLTTGLILGGLAVKIGKKLLGNEKEKENSNES